jgi:hypothetical protein
LARLHGLDLIELRSSAACACYLPHQQQSLRLGGAFEASLFIMEIYSLVIGRDDEYYLTG